jgi:murein DD-endopeptidase MepM/ murein hydrolase activator NlpD
MARTKYKFDPESLQFTEQDTRSKFVRTYIGVIVAGILIAIALLFVSAYVIVPPSLRKMKRENNQASQDLKDLTQKYEQMEKVLKDIEKRDENIYKAILESDPNEAQNDSASEVVEILKMFEGKRPTEIAEFLDAEIDKVLVALSEDESKYKKFAKVLDTKAKMLVHIPSIQPVKNDDLEVMIYGFGKRIDPFYKTPKDHNGMDYSVPEGTKVFATANGTVSFVGRKRGKGNVVIINHGYGFETMYGHLDQILTHVGKKVERGDYIGTSGNSGKSMSPHLHYEVHLNDKPLNPVNFYFADLSPSQYNKMIKFSSRGGVSLD